MLQVCELTAILSSTLFAGAALYINLAEHPARMSCGTKLAATVFGPSYKRAAVMQATLAMVATGSGIASWWLDNSLLWILGSLFIFAVIPFTVIVISPTNARLLTPNLDRNSESAHELLIRWGRLHAVRTAASLAASILFIIATQSN